MCAVCPHGTDDGGVSHAWHDLTFFRKDNSKQIFAEETPSTQNFDKTVFRTVLSRLRRLLRELVPIDSVKRWSNLIHPQNPPPRALNPHTENNDGAEIKTDRS